MPLKIGVPVPTSRDLEYNRKAGPEYAAAVERMGGTVISISLDAECKERSGLAAQCAGFVLPGSPADVDPPLYRQQRDPASAASDGAREICDRLLLEHAAATGKPVLAICFGAQFLNVWRGGTLVQDLSPIPVNHEAGSSVAAAHSVRVAGQSLLAGLLGQAEAPVEGDFRRLTVNSSHHQAIAAPGDDLAVVARAIEDGVIEAVEGRIGLAVMIGVQWHPERSVEISAASRALFTWLVLEAEDWQRYGATGTPENLDARLQ